MSISASPHHPHGPEDPRFLDDEKRCLLCGLAVKHDRERIAFALEIRAIQQLEDATEPGDIALWRSVLKGVRDYDARNPDDRLPAVWDLNHGERLA